MMLRNGQWHFPIALGVCLCGCMRHAEGAQGDGRGHGGMAAARYGTTGCQYQCQCEMYLHAIQ